MRGTWLSPLGSRDNFGSVILIAAPFSMRRVAETSRSVLRCRGLTLGVLYLHDRAGTHPTRRPNCHWYLYLSFSFNLSQ